MKVKPMVRAVLALLAPLVLAVAASPPAQAAPACFARTPVCGGVEGGSFVFTVEPPPATLTVQATVNGEPVTGSLTHFAEPGRLHGSYEPYPSLVPGDVMCLTLQGPGLPPGPYCDTVS